MNGVSSDLHREFASVKGDLQKLNLIERKMVIVLERLSTFEHQNAAVEIWE